MKNRFTPAPGAQALQVRKLCDELTRAVAVLARRGIADFDAIDAAGAAFLLVLVEWETAEENVKDLFWCYVLSAFNAVTHAWRMAATEHAAERDGEGWKTA